MANEIRGMVIAVSPIKEVASTEAGKQPIRKRSIYLNCTRHDSITGEQIGNENKPVLEFSGDRTLEKVNPILDTLARVTLSRYCSSSEVHRTRIRRVRRRTTRVSVLTT